MNRKNVYFENLSLKHDEIVSNPPKKMFPQETDWTCSIACIRTLLSAIENEILYEIDIVKKYHLTPGPYYSKDIKNIQILNNYDVIYGCDNKNFNFDDVLSLIEDGYYVMVETMYNYSHWFVLIGYYPNYSNDLEKSSILIYDPYYDNTRLLNVDEFLSMWIDGNYEYSKVEKDFIAIKNKKNEYVK